jgi:hypothetical protein
MPRPTMRSPSRLPSLLASKFHQWHKSGSPRTFVRYLKSELSGCDLSWLQKGNLRESLAEVGIDPDVHLRSRLSADYVKVHLRQIVTELADIVGEEGLHDNGMNSPEKIPLPLQLRCPGTFPLSMQYREEPVITRQALQRKLVKTTGKAWAAILDQTGFSRVNRRIASRSFSQTVQMFVALQRGSRSRWTKASLRQKHPFAFKAAWNLTNRMDAAGVPTALRKELRKDPLFTLWSVASAFLSVDDMDRAVALFIRKKSAFAKTFYATHVRI